MKVPTEQESQSQILAFAEQWGTMHGAMAACKDPLAEDIRSCATLLFNNWNKITQMPEPTDPAFKSKVLSYWETFSGHAHSMQTMSPPETCENLATKARASRLWTICKRTGEGGKPADTGSSMSAPIQIH